MPIKTLIRVLGYGPGVGVPNGYATGKSVAFEYIITAF